MSFFSMTGISKLFGGASLTEEERANLVKEVMLMTLARAAASDTNIKSVEIDKVSFASRCDFCTACVSDGTLVYLKSPGT